MLTRRWAGFAVLLAGFVGGPARGQDPLLMTREGAKTANELLAACVRDGGLEQVGKGSSATWRVDPVKLRATLAGQRDRLTPAARDALVVAILRGDATKKQPFAAVLEAFGQETKDERALGFAALLTADMRRERLQAAEAVAAYRRAASHFAAASDPAYQAISLNHLGVFLLDRGEYGRAEDPLQEALALCRKVCPPGKFPDGHPVLAQSLNNLGLLLQARLEYGRAEGPLQEALAMQRKLYPAAKFPDGHPDLAASLSSLGLLWAWRGEGGRAEEALREALAMRRKLYPAGKLPDVNLELAYTLHSLGELLRDRGEYARAEGPLREALTIYQRLGDRLAQSAPEAQALNLVASFPLTRDTYLSATRRLKDHPAAAAYALVWQSKAALFYRNLWQEKLPPVEALRRAQLALYRHPEHVKAWARGERGPDLKHPAPGSKPAAPEEGGPKPGGTAPTKLWAAFSLSGLGR
jgi:tetratricopeptide (TPR) repeat protein